MKLTYSYNSLKDISNLSQGEKFIEILLSHGLVIDKVDDHEPVRRAFDISMLSEHWKGIGPTGGHSTCYFLFKGQKKINFSGMVTWNINLGSRSKVFNGVHLWLNTSKNFNTKELIKLGDDLFIWSGAVYGYVTDNSKDKSKIVPGGIYLGLPGLMWVNYFGPVYIKEPDFRIPPDYISVGHGIRYTLTETPIDDRLDDPSFLKHWKDYFGYEWFWEKPRRKLQVPLFDNSELCRQ